MVSRYDVARAMATHWSLLTWRGDEHAKGIYFNERYGYLLERSYAVRIRHDEPAPSVFYIPNPDDTDREEVVTTYPYKNLIKMPKKCLPLFEGNSLEESNFDEIFGMASCSTLILPIKPLMNLLLYETNKRLRDRSRLSFQRKGKDMEVSLNSKKEEVLHSERFEIFSEISSNEEKNSRKVMVNANNMLHAMNLMSYGHILLNSNENVHISISSDKIKMNVYTSTLKVESVIPVCIDRIK